MSLLLKEQNIISLRTAYVSEHDGRNLVSLSLTEEVKEKWKVEPGRYYSMPKDYAYLYRYRISQSEEKGLAQGSRSWELQLKPLSFETKPEFRLLWTLSGNSVALYLNGEPWAFICEETHYGYSKGILSPLPPEMPRASNSWDQQLFKKIFEIE